MKRLFMTAGSLAAICLFQVASAEEAQVVASLQAVEGKVFVDHGDGFSLDLTNKGLRPGDRVMISGEGKAVLAYVDSCSFELGRDSMTVVTDTACVDGIQTAALDVAGATAMFPPAAGGAAALGAGSAAPLLTGGGVAGIAAVAGAGAIAAIGIIPSGHHLTSLVKPPIVKTTNGGSP